MKTKYIIFSILLIGFFLQAQTTKHLLILHSNDTHSRIEPLPSSNSFAPNDGGIVRRATYFDQIRRNNKNVLIFDAGDFVQGTPYFNLFKGEVETEAMNRMGYNAGTLGNHEFDYGLDVLVKLVKRIKYPIVNCNYDFSATPLKGLVKPYIVIKKDGFKIGVLGVGADPEGLVSRENYKGMVFNPIISSVNKYAEILKKKKKCDIIVCLSHVGYTSAKDVVNDYLLAQKSRYIDVIIGGHSHTFLKEPVVVKDLDGKNVLISQMGSNGAFVGRIDVDLEETPLSK